MNGWRDYTMKKISCMFLCVIITIQLCSCSSTNSYVSGGVFLQSNSSSSQDDKQNVSSAVSEALSSEKYNSNNDLKVPDNMNQQQGYNFLNDTTEKQLYLLFKERSTKVSNVKNVKGYYELEAININSKLTDKTIKKVYNAFEYDNPQIFWLSSTFAFANTGSTTEVKLYSVYSASQVKQMQTKLNSALNKAIASANGVSSQYEKEKRIHDWLVNQSKYDTSATSSDHLSFTAYGAMVNGKAVCQGYAKAMQLMLNSVGIQCITIVGKSKNESHMWNVVKIDGEWYHLDSTWNDSSNSNIYDYFNVTDDIIKYDHVVSPTYDKATTDVYNIMLPKCTSMKANYFELNAVKVDTLDEDCDKLIIDELSKVAYNKLKVIYIKFGDSLDYESSINKFFLTAPYKFSYYISVVNDSVDNEHKIDAEKVTFVKCKAQNAVTVNINYS